MLDVLRSDKKWRQPIGRRYAVGHSPKIKVLCFRSTRNGSDKSRPRRTDFFFVNFLRLSRSDWRDASLPAVYRDLAHSVRERKKCAAAVDADRRSLNAFRIRFPSVTVRERQSKPGPGFPYAESWLCGRTMFRRVTNALYIFIFFLFVRSNNVRESRRVEKCASWYGARQKRLLAGPPPFTVTK